jgi:polyribonucleotide nucleotidyltransferase
MLNNPKSVEKLIGPEVISLTTGAMAKQANGSVVLRCGNAVLLATVTASKAPRPGIDFFPLTVEYIEKMYAAGKIPGGFFKREAKPRTSATLAARLIDRPIRPCFPSTYNNDVQVIVTVLSFDEKYSPEFLGIIASSAALSVSDIPFTDPVGAALVAMVDGQYVFNPTAEQLERSALDIVVAGTKDAILMIEAGANEVSEEDILKAIQFGHGYIKETIALQEQLVSQAGKPKQAAPEGIKDALLESKVASIIGTQIEDNMKSGNKQAIDEFLKDLEGQVNTALVHEDQSNQFEVSHFFHKIKKDKIRSTIIRGKIRPDGRRLDEIRPIEIEVGLLPSVHGSSLFTRGETQSLGVTTLGTPDDEQTDDGLRKTTKSAYFFHYNFPAYSVGEIGNYARTSRRELGHGALAERAIRGVLPTRAEFPYTIRLVSEILESNGSSSMASVCSGALSLMDCGVPIKAPVSGIAMGLLIDESGYVVLSDIQGLEDHYGDMDFKVAGSRNGITALQLDIKVGGLSDDILRNALDQAKRGRLHILDKMLEVLGASRDQVAANAPKIDFIMVKPDKIGVIIGPGGKMIRKIEEESGAKVSISESVEGQVCLSGDNAESVEKAKRMISGLVKEIEKGEVYDGKVVRITNFGAFIELLPGKEGLLHISKISKERINRVEDVLKEGEIIRVKVADIDAQQRVSLISSAYEQN